MDGPSPFDEQDSQSQEVVVPMTPPCFKLEPDDGFSSADISLSLFAIVVPSTTSGLALIFTLRVLLADLLDAVSDDPFEAIELGGEPTGKDDKPDKDEVEDAERRHKGNKLDVEVGLVGVIVAIRLVDNNVELDVVPADLPVELEAPEAKQMVEPFSSLTLFSSLWLTTSALETSGTTCEPRLETRR